MAWLAPWFLLGGAAVAAPILFHLWRRTPRGHRTFSTLMFLSPSPPRVTRLSRIEHWWLLLLRAGVLALIALAFARPVWRYPSTVPQDKDETELRVFLVDTSASLQREGCWKDVDRKLREQLDQLPASAQFAVITFDDRPITRLSLDESKQLGRDVARSVALERWATIQPGWRGTRLGEAAVAAAQMLQDAQSQRVLPCPQRVVILSDFASGSDLSALREFDWPDALPVECISIAAARPGNAGLQLVAASADSAETGLRVRASNSQENSGQQFQIVWGDEERTPCFPVVVPPGQSRVIALPAPPTLAAGRSVILQGDAEPFDNQLWLPVRQPRQCQVVYFGADQREDTAGNLYYLERALAANPRYEVTLIAGSDLGTLLEAPSLVVASDVTPEARLWLPRLREAGVTLLLVPRDAAQARELVAMTGWDGATIDEAPAATYQLWSDIDFESSWFAPFAAARFADFSGIHFWKHRRVTGALPTGSDVVVRFDNTDPAVVRLGAKNGRGSQWLWTSGWNPADSQLSRSSKFVPLMWQVLESTLESTSGTSSQTVGEPLRQASSTPSPAVVTLADGSTVDWPADQPTFDRTDRPGRYEVDRGSAEEIIAVNLPPEESRVDPLPREQLEAFGLTLSSSAIPAQLPAQLDELRQQQVAELEERQQLWKWLLLGAGCLVMVETVWLMVSTHRTVGQQGEGA